MGDGVEDGTMAIQLTSAEAALRRIDLVGLATQTEPIAGVDARGLARELYGVEGEPEPLHGERNDNYRIVDRDGVGKEFGVVPEYPAVAFIDEAACIGCTKCIQACPVDAIVGASRAMHTVIAAECTGCELCIPPCPVDCIVMRPAPGVLTAQTH